MSNKLNISALSFPRRLVQVTEPLVGLITRNKHLKLVSTLIGIAAAGFSILNSMDRTESRRDYTIEVVENDVLLAGIEVACLDGSGLVQVTGRLGTVGFPSSCSGKSIRVSHPVSNRILDTRPLGSAKTIRIPVVRLPAEKLMKLP